MVRDIRFPIEVRLRQCVCLLSVVSLSFGVLAFVRLRHVEYKRQVSQRIHQEMELQIKIGMSRSQIVRILGGEPGDYSEHPVYIKGPISGWTNAKMSRYNQSTWTGDTGEIIVCFDEMGAVQFSIYREVLTDSRPLAQRFLSWFRKNQILLKLI